LLCNIARYNAASVSEYAGRVVQKPVAADKSFLAVGKATMSPPGALPALIGSRTAGLTVVISLLTGSSSVFASLQTTHADA